MYENTRKHYRVAQRNLQEDPYHGIYMTKEEHQKYMIATLAMVLLSFLSAVVLIFKKKL